MPGKLNVFNLGELGVNVDKSPIHTDDGELRSAKNAIQDPFGVAGGIRKRPGLIKLNSTAGAGSILGGIGVPLLDQFSASTSVHNFYFARRAAAGWRGSSDNWATGSNTTGVPAALRSSALSPVSDFNVGTSHNGHPGCVYNNRLYYAGNDFTAGTTDPTIRIFDGAVDQLLTRIPYNPDVGVGTRSRGVVTMIAANNTIYVATLDGGTTDADFRGRVFQLNPDTGQLTQLGTTIATGHVPYSLCFWLGKLWVGTARRTHTNLANVYWIRPLVDTVWTFDVTMPTGLFIIPQMVTYRGELYACTVTNSAVNNPQIRKRTTLGVWSQSQAYSAAADNDGIQSLAEFNGNLYAGTETGTTVIVKFDGTSWTSVYIAGTAGEYNNMYVHNGRLYVSNGTTSGGSTGDLVSSADGSVWTDHVSALNGDEGQGVFVALVS
jgi:hypothetical protein